MRSGESEAAPPAVWLPERIRQRRALRALTAGGALAPLAVAAVILGVVARLVHFDDTLLGDELSTLYTVHDQSLGDVLSQVRSDAEISPPLYFVLAWGFGQLGSNPELIRLPALIAGLASIPLTFLLARRLFGHSAGLVAAAIIALNPFMVFYATEARPYTLAIAFLLGSTLAMLVAAERRSLGWWAAYAALVALAMYSHYTAAFVLGAQLLWLLWARPEVRAPAIVATAAAALTYLPWVPGVLDDYDSPTTKILSALQGNGFSVKLDAIGNWAFGYPYQSTHTMPGELALAVGIAAVGLLALGASARFIRGVRPAAAARESDVTKALVLAAALALATPVAEAAILLTGDTDLFGARNLNIASGGFAVLLGGLAATAGPLVAALGVTGLLAAFAVGTVKSLDSDHAIGDFRAAAAFINGSAGVNDVVVDMQSALLTPVPTTPLSAHMSGEERLYNLYLPAGPPPFLLDPPPPRPILEQAIRTARDGRLFLVAESTTVREADGGVGIVLPRGSVSRTASQRRAFGERSAGSANREPAPSDSGSTANGRGARSALVELPGWRLTESRRFEGSFVSLNVFVLSPPPRSLSGTQPKAQQR